MKTGGRCLSMIKPDYIANIVSHDITRIRRAEAPSALIRAFEAI